MPKTVKKLYLDPGVIKRTEDYARRRGTNLSTLVSDYLDALTRGLTQPEHGPLVQRLLGAGVAGAQPTKKRSQTKPGIENYRLHLDEKYGDK